MSKSFPLPQGLMALSLSVTLLAGCAGTPVAVPATPGTPAATTPAADAPASQPSAQTPAAPAMPAPAAAAPMTLTGAATFRGEALSGYTVTVLDAQTGEPVTVTNDLASAKGLAVLAQTLKTDANGRFTLQVANLGAGQALRVQVAYGNAKLESIVTANGQALGAKGYSVADTATVFEISELTTAIARIAANVIRTTKMLTAEEAAPELAKLAAEMASLTSRLEDDLKSSPGLAKDIVSVEGETGEKAVESLIRNAGELKALTNSIAGLVADIAKTASTSKAIVDPKVRESLTNIEYTGTVIGGSFDKTGTFKLSNLIDGNSINANGGNLTDVTTRLNRPNSSGNSVSRDPNGIYVGTWSELKEALSDTKKIYLTADIVSDSTPITMGPGITFNMPESLQPTHSITIDGQGHTLTAPVVMYYGSTLANLTLPGAVSVLNNQAGYHVAVVSVVQPVATPMVFDHVTFSAMMGGVTLSTPPEDVTMSDCLFTGATISATMGSHALTVQNSTFENGATAITVTSASRVTLTGNHFTNRSGVTARWSPSTTYAYTNNVFASTNAALVGVEFTYSGTDTVVDVDSALTAALGNTFTDWVGTSKAIKTLLGGTGGTGGTGGIGGIGGVGGTGGFTGTCITPPICAPGTGGTP